MKKPQTISVKGLSIDEIMNMDLSSMGEKDLKTIANRLVSASNKRVRRLESSNIGKESPALMDISKRGGKFSVKGKSFNQIRNEVANMRNFLSKKTSSVSGFKKVRKQVEKRIGGKMTNEQSSDFWSNYRKLEELQGGLFKELDSTTIQRELYQTMYVKNSTDTIGDMVERLNNMYNDIYDDEDYDEDEFYDFF